MMRDTDAFPRVPDFTSTFYLKLRARMFPKCSRVPQNVPQNVPQITFREQGNEILFPKCVSGTWERVSYSPKTLREQGNEILFPK